jgi:hypothetical protein
LRAFERDDAGQANVEMALILPILLMLIPSTLEFGAAPEGDRLVVVQNADVDQGDVKGAIATALSRSGITMRNE